MKVSAVNARPKKSLLNSWSQAALLPAFPHGRADIWRVRLDEPSRKISETSLLSPDELSRAGRFHFEKDRLHFSRCRCALRDLLAEYLAIPAVEIRLEYQPNGKPQLAAEQNPRMLQFNVSHSANTALIAIGSQCQLGVDIEKIREDVDVASLAERFFSAREGAEIRALPHHLLVPGFFACWTRKEAFLKASGVGLSFPLKEFSVTTHPERDPELVDLQGDTEAGKKWLLADLTVLDGYRATVALDRPDARLETYAWN